MRASIVTECWEVMCREVPLARHMGQRAPRGVPRLCTRRLGDGSEVGAETLDSLFGFAFEEVNLGRVKKKVEGFSDAWRYVGREAGHVLVGRPR